MKILYKNNAASTLDAGIDDTVLTLDVNAGDGSLFPSPADGTECFFVTLSNATSMEIVKVTDRTGDTFTIERAQEGTSAASFNSGDKVELLITAGIMEDLRDNSLRTDNLTAAVIEGLNSDQLDGLDASDFFFRSESLTIPGLNTIDFRNNFKEAIKLSTEYGSAFDPYWSNVELFLTGQGTLGGTNFIDSSKNNLVFQNIGSTIYTKDQKKFGETSLKIANRHVSKDE